MLLIRCECGHGLLGSRESYRQKRGEIKTLHSMRAKASDEDVRMIRHLHEEYGIGYRELAKKFELHVSTIRGFCRYERRPDVY